MPDMDQTNGAPKWLWLPIALLLLSLAAFFFWRGERENRYDQQIVFAAKRYNLDPALIKAVIWQESNFRAEATGKAGEIGLMQVREDAAYEWAEAEKIDNFQHGQIRDPGKNILAGTFYLSKILKRYLKTDNPLPYALADYNAGRAHVLRWKKGPADTNSAAFLAQMDYPGTRLYAQRIMDRQAYYKQNWRPPAPAGQ